MLLKDPEVKQSLKNSIEYLEDTLETISKGEGTAGMLVKDPEVPRQVRRILVQVEDAIEDFREQAPISTFVSAIFQAF
jgi:uncharacterized protein (UPF0147 family)